MCKIFLLYLWAWQAGFKYLQNWFNHLHSGWETLENYFKYRVTTALSEGLNNVVKTIKKRAYGYRTSEYFRFKIMQVCGYLNSRFIGVDTVSESTRWRDWKPLIFKGCRFFHQECSVCLRSVQLFRNLKTLRLNSNLKLVCYVSLSCLK